jgi:predicted permease
MTEVLMRMAGLIALGVAWRHLQPGGLGGDTMRQATSTLVYYLLLPALVVETLWSSTLGLDAVRIAATAVAVVATGWWLGRLAAGALALSAPRTGALILAAAFPNATYLGLPALDAALGPVGRGIAVQFDYFACTPILLTLGVLMAQRHGHHDDGCAQPAWARLARVPPFWAAVVGVALNTLGVALPAALAGLLATLASAVVPLMLLGLGMSLSWRSVERRAALAIAPVLVIQLLALPVLAWALGLGLGLSGHALTGTVLEAAMPSMVLGVVLCDRYGLDTRLYSIAVTASTVLALATLPVWHYLLTAT